MAVLTGSDEGRYLEPLEADVYAITPRPWESRLLWTVRFGRELANIAKTGRYDTVLIRYAASNALLLGAIMRRVGNVRWGFEVNSFAYHRFVQKRELPRWLCSRVLQFELRALQGARFLYVVSDQLRKDVVESRPSWAARVRVSPNAGPSPVRIAAPIDDSDEITFAYLGRLVHYYDIDLVLKAFQSFANGYGRRTSLHIFGDGEQLERIRDAGRNLSNVHIHGRYDLNHIVLTRQVSTNTVLLLPYRRGRQAEIGSPTKLYEYMSLGLPIIASDIGQTRQVLRHGITGLLYAPGDSESLVGAMHEAARNGDLRQRMMSSLCEEYAGTHTWAVRMRDLHRWLATI